jgi:hypothetical protein
MTHCVVRYLKEISFLVEICKPDKFPFHSMDFKKYNFFKSPMTFLFPFFTI